MSYPKAEENIPRFLCYLLEKDVINDYKLNKEQARNIYNDEFKSKYEINGFSFSKMFSYLRYFQVIKYDKKTETMRFKAEILNNISLDTNLVKRKSFNLRKVLTEQENAKIDPTTINTTSLGDILQKKQKSDFKECTICNYICLNSKTFKRHEKSKNHQLKVYYISVIKNLPTTHLNIIAEVSTGYGGEMEDVIVYVKKATAITLNLLNGTQFEFDIIEFIIINDTNYVRPQEFILPQVLGEQSSFSISIDILFKEIIYWTYPIVFKLKNRENGLEIEIIKELRLHVYSQLLEDLRPVKPYKKPALINRFVTKPGKIIRGLHPKKAETDFVPKFKLQQYSLPHNIITLLNENLKDFEGITPQQRNILNDIRKLLKDYKTHNTLTQDNYYYMLELLLFFEEYQMWRNIRIYDVDNQVLTYITNNQNNFLQFSVPGLAEHRPSLLRGDSVLVSEQNEYDRKYEGVVHYVQQNSVLLKFCNSFMEKARQNNSKYSVSFTFNRVTLRAEHQAIRLIKQHNAIRVLFKQGVPSKKEDLRTIEWINPSINDNERQQNAVRNILSKSAFPMPYLVFGPPGTGKTVTIIEAILQVWTMSAENILVCAPSNNTANEITKRLIECISPENLFRYVALSYPQQLINKDILPYVNLKENEYYHPTLEQLKSYRIIVTTLVTAARIVNSGIPDNHFSYVFIDESSKATESETLIPIAGILTNSKNSGKLTGQIVLAGDPKQLGPLIYSTLAQIYSFDTSMLERLMNTNHLYFKNENGQYNDMLITKLVKSYRSHPSIMELPNKLFYDNELESVGDKEITHLFLNWKQLPNPQFPLIFHSVLGKDEQEETSPSFFNLQEIDIVISYLEKLIDQDISGRKILIEDIGIITPYRKQAEKFGRALSKKNWGNLMVGSVESFQGQEKLIIIISTVRSKPEFLKGDIKYHLGFLKNPKRFNVALTRAKALVIVVGNPIILQYDPYWNVFVRYCRHNKLCIGTPFVLRNMNTKFDIDKLQDQLSLDQASRNSLEVSKLFGPDLQFYEEQVSRNSLEDDDTNTDVDF